LEELETFFHSVERGDITIDSEETPSELFSTHAYGSVGTTRLYSSNGWRLCVDTKDGLWNDISSVVCDKGRNAGKFDLTCKQNEIDEGSDEEVFWRRYRMAVNGPLRCLICQIPIDGKNELHYLTTCGMWIQEKFKILNPGLYPEHHPSIRAYFEKLRARGHFLELHRDVRDLFDLENLPAHLKMLTLRFWLEINELPELPESLEHLAILNYQDLEKKPVLPAGIKALTIGASGAHLDLPALPSGLEALFILNARTVSGLSPLPPGLKVLTLCVGDLREIPALPATLESLEIDCGSADRDCNDALTTLPSLPEGLNRLSLAFLSSLESLPELPDRLEHLGLHRVPSIRQSRLPASAKRALETYRRYIEAPSQLDQVRSAFCYVKEEIDQELASSLVPDRIFRDRLEGRLSAMETALASAESLTMEELLSIRDGVHHLGALTLILGRICQLRIEGLLEEGRADALIVEACTTDFDYGPFRIDCLRSIMALESRKRRIESRMDRGLYPEPLKAMARKRIIMIENMIEDLREELLDPGPGKQPNLRIYRDLVPES